MLKLRCEYCTRLIVCMPVKENERNFCVDGCRENWKRAMRRLRIDQKAPSAATA